MAVDSDTVGLVARESIQDTEPLSSPWRKTAETNAIAITESVKDTGTRKAYTLSKKPFGPCVLAIVAV